MKEIAKKEKKGIYDFVIGLLVITSLGFYDIKWLFLGTQGLALFVTLFRFLLGVEKLEKYWVKYFVWSGLFAAYSAMSGMWAQEINRTVMSCTVATIQVCLVGLCVILYCKDQIKIQNVINFFIFTAICLCIRFIITVPISEWGQQARFSKDSIFGGNSPAMVLAYASVLIVWKAFGMKNITKEKKRVINLVLIGIFMFVSVLMGTKKGLIIFGIGFVMIMLDNANAPVAFIKRFFIVGILAVIAYNIIMNVDIFYNAIGYRIESMLAGFAGEETDMSTEMRMFFMEDAVRVFSENPILGIGQDGFRYANRYAFTYSHNNYLEVLANLGIIGVWIYYSLHLRILRRAIAEKRNNILPLVLSIIILVIDISVVSYSDEIEGMVLAMLYALVYVPKGKEIKEVKNA